MKVDGSDMQQKTAMTEKRQPQTLQDWVVRMSGQIKNALPASITPERMTRIALTALNTNQQLARCSRDSFLGALLTAAQLGLEVNTPLGQAYLIPYGNKAQFQLGYQGLLELCYRTGQYKRIVARVVYDGDFFEYEYGLNERLAHKPANKSKQPVAVYGLYELKNGAAAFEVMTWADVTAHKNKFSQSANSKSSPWKTDEEAMAKKTVLKKVLKYAPKTVEAANALAGDSHIVNAKVVGNTVTTQIDYSFEGQQEEQGAITQEVQQPPIDDADDDVAKAFNAASGNDNAPDFPSAEEAEEQGLEF